MNIKQIISKKDPLIQEVLQLKKEKNTPFYVAEGTRVVETIAERYSKSIMYIFVTKTELLDTITKNVLQKCILVSDHVMEALSEVKTAPGILALCKYDFKKDIPETPALLCYNISDPGNLGTLFRSAAAFGAKSVVCIDGVNPLHPKVIQASAGTIHAISLYKMTEPIFFNSVLKDVVIIALTTQSGQDLSQLKKSNKNYIVAVGNEAHGLPQPFIDRCSFSATIPIKGVAESLNAAIAGSIAMYELF